MESDGFKNDAEVDNCVEDDPEEMRIAKLCFQNYAEKKGLTLHSFSQMPPEQLAEYLKDFYSVIKPNTPTFIYKIRKGLQKYFQTSDGIDIVVDEAFCNANQVIQTEYDVKQPTNRRANRVKLECEILKKIYLGPAMKLDNPETLQNKIFFDVNMYFCNRGKEFLRVMAKKDFLVCTDLEGRKYVCLKFLPKFNLTDGTYDVDIRREGEGKIIGQRMYERPGDPRCPVASFLLYLNHLHPMIDAFWQRPKRHFVPTDYVWYDNTALGNSTLGKIMTRICQASSLCDNYTHHAIRSTYITAIEKMCTETLGRGYSPVPMMFADPQTQDHPVLSKQSAMVRPVVPIQLTAATSTLSPFEDPSYGLTQAKLKVLEVVNGLQVKNLKHFVDWMKTFKVEKDAGGLVVLCNTVEMSAPSSSVGNGSLKGDNFNSNGVSRESSPGLTMSHKESKQLPVSGLARDLSAQNFSMNSSRELENKDLKIEIKQVEFETLGSTSCSNGKEDETGAKVTIPSHDTLLLTGVQSSTQVIIHNKENSVHSPEPLESRIFASRHSMDIAEVTAFLSTQNNKRPRFGIERHDSLSLLEDKAKPVKKRSLTDLKAGNSWNDADIQNKRMKTEDSKLPSATLKNASDGLVYPVHVLHSAHSRSNLGSSSYYVTSNSAYYDSPSTSHSSSPISFALPKNIQIKTEPQFD